MFLSEEVGYFCIEVVIGLVDDYVWNYEFNMVVRIGIVVVFDD